MIRHSSDRGAALIHVTVVLIGLILFSGFVVDYGTFWVARGQAQNAADAGALAGAVARIFDDSSNPPASTTSGKVYESVVAAVARNFIWGVSAPASTVNLSYTCPDSTTNCVAVDVYRDGTNHSAAVPTFFLRLVNINSQGTRAHAVAEPVAANAVDCIKPWMAPDKGTGVTYGLSDVGTFLVLRAAGAPSQYQQADLAFSGGECPNGGGKCYGDAMGICVPGPDPGGAWSIGDQIWTKNGGTSGQQDQMDIYNQDPTATWDPTTRSVTNSCADPSSGAYPCKCAATSGLGCANGQNGKISPRIIQVAAFDPTALLALGSGKGSLPIQEFLSVFMLEPGVGDPSNPDNAPCVADSNNVCGYFALSQGQIKSSAPSVASSTNVAIVLIR